MEIVIDDARYRAISMAAIRFKPPQNGLFFQKGVFQQNQWERWGSHLNFSQ
jgi:hypothetical protein